jgi:Fic family protein
MQRPIPQSPRPADKAPFPRSVTPPDDHPAHQAVSIELSKAQIDQILRSASGEGAHFSTMLHGLAEARETMISLSELESHRLSTSLLAGLLMLASFPDDGSYLGNAEIARLLGMNPSTTHRYLGTLVEVGLLERHPNTRRYRLAP